jgi:catechol 2,3-dioxygenase-like lactoylglutathione lyase family enzyme
MTEFSTPRALDHLVLPVEDIDRARQRYEQLGFTVAPDGRHPFGTENCCVFLADGTFLEPLGIAHRETCEARAVSGNSFVANDQAFRFRRGEEGFSHLVLKSEDASADHGLFKAHGMSGGRMVRFSRTFDNAEGETGKVSFHLAFAADRRSPDSGFFTCQTTRSAGIGRALLQQHENGALGLKQVILSEVNPTDFQYFLQVLLNQREMDVDSFGMSFDASGAKVSVMSPAGLSAFYGLNRQREERGMRFEAFVLTVSSLSRAAGVLKTNKVDFEHRNDRLLIAPAHGLGSTLILEEA